VKIYFEGVDRTHPDPAAAAHTTFDVDHIWLETRFHGITADVSRLIDRHPARKIVKSNG
jgi:hypothetical protein